ncbi:F-box/LRR-repeat protein At3g48880 isoform X1 [Elaeis guineensis]|uniref:F-box/LRR-repeat protein At3g48880 isoform X1 n=1 Tax=Elaeis guineensis var. tenera TaxID=51953 RepID=UPI003C6D53EB
MGGPEPDADFAEPSDRRVQKEEGKMNASEETMKSKQVIDIRRWEDLPLDCLVNIFKRLGVEDITTGVPFVCKSWYEAHLDPSCWKIIDLRAMYQWPQSPFIGRFMHAYHLKKFKTRGFLKIIIKRSHKLLSELVLPDHLLPLSEMVYICKECPMANIYAPWHSEKDRGFIRSFVQTFNEAVMQHSKNIVIYNNWYKYC